MQVTRQVAGQVPAEVERLLEVVLGEMKRADIQAKLGLSHRENFVEKYLKPALRLGVVETQDGHHVLDG